MTERTKLRILDAGAGLNPFQILLAVLGHFVVSLDLNVKYTVKLSKIVNKSDKLKSRIYPYLADIFKIPFRENFFDRVICISVIEHILNYLNPTFNTKLSYLILKALMCELVRVVRPGGKVCITLDVDLSGKRHLSLDEVKMLANMLHVEIPHLPKDILVSNMRAYGNLFGPNKTVFAIVLTKQGY